MRRAESGEMEEEEEEKEDRGRKRGTKGNRRKLGGSIVKSRKSIRWSAVPLPCLVGCA